LKRLTVAAAIMLLGLVSAWLSPPQQARAQSESAYDLINTVNALRTSLGLAAYRVDPWLMTYAQEHADYIDSLNSGTHLHSDGTLPWDNGVQENVAGGTAGYVTAAVVVYQIWVDEGHLKTMTGYPAGEIGAGVAYSADNDQTYFVIDVRPAAEEVAASAPAATAVFVPYTTSTPQADGWIVHTVTEGQTLWSIAISYGTTVATIRELNGIPADSTQIYVGQALKIILAAAVIPATQVSDATPAGQYAAATSIPPSTTPSPSPTATPQPSQTPTSTPTNWLQRLPPERVTGAIVLVIIGVVGLFVVIRFGFIGARRVGR
jgi:LysM repeat protein